MLKLLLHYKRQCVFCVLVLAPWQSLCFAQSGNEPPSQQTNATAQQTPSSIQQELDALKARVDQLEVELKDKKAQEQKTATGAAVPAKAVEQAPATPLASTGVSATTENSQAGTGGAAETPASTSSNFLGTNDGKQESSSVDQAAEPWGSPCQSSDKNAEPFSFADFTWLNGNSREKDSPLNTSVFTGEFRLDTSYIDDFAHPIDHTLVGSSESGRTNEVQVQQLGVGGDFHCGHIRGRVMTQLGMYSTMTPRNDATPGRGQWDLSDAYRYLSEAYGGYHFDVLHGINVDAGIFMSYVGLFSYYNYDNWAYQPSYVSSNTPWFFNGIRVQIFPTAKLKIETWFINGWQSYGTANGRPGLGLQVLWRPNGAISILGNQYGVGRDTLGAPYRTRWHTDDSIEVKYYDNPLRFLDKSAFSLTLDAGCESGSGVTCFKSSWSLPKQYFLGYMIYNRFWFHRDQYGLTLGGGGINNPGRYLVLLPPINGATAFSGTPYFPENPSDPFHAWDASATFDYMPNQFVTFRWEFDHRAANVPYFAGPGGVTPPGGNVGLPGSVVPGWAPDLAKDENRINIAILVKL